MSLSSVLIFFCVLRDHRKAFVSRMLGVMFYVIGQGPIEQCVGDLCSVPQGGVKKGKIS